MEVVSSVAGDSGETKALLLKHRQETVASPKPEMRKTQARNYCCHNTHARTRWTVQSWSTGVCACTGVMLSCIRFQLHTPVLQRFVVKGSTPVQFLLSSIIWNQTVSPQGLSKYHAIISTQIWIKAYLRRLFEKVGIKFSPEVLVENYA